MTADPLDALRGADRPTDPEAAFAADLRARLVRALTTGVPMSSTTTTAPAYPVNGVRQGDVSYVTLQVPDLAAAQAFYGAVLGWTFQPGRVENGAQVLDTAPMVGLHGGTGGRAGAVLSYRVDDVAAAVTRIRAAGGRSSDVEQAPYGATARCVDTQGLPFWLHEAADEVVVPEGARLRSGDLSYITFGVEDGERDRAFYAAALGWTYAQGNPRGLLPETGVWSPGERRAEAPQDESTHQLGAVLCYQVEDIAAAVGRARTAGGRVEDPVRRPYGLESHGYDDQGIELYLHQLDQ